MDRPRRHWQSTLHNTRLGKKNSKPDFLIECSPNIIKIILLIWKLPILPKNISFEHVKWPSQRCRLLKMAIYAFKRGFFNSIFRIWTDEVSRQHLNMIQLFSKNLSLVKKLTPLYPPEKHSAQMQLCCNSNLLKLPLVPQRKKKHP